MVSSVFSGYSATMGYCSKQVGHCQESWQQYAVGIACLYNKQISVLSKQLSPHRFLLLQYRQLVVARFRWRLGGYYQFDRLIWSRILKFIDTVVFAYLLHCKGSDSFLISDIQLGSQTLLLLNKVVEVVQFGKPFKTSCEGCWGLSFCYLKIERKINLLIFLLSCFRLIMERNSYLQASFQMYSPVLVWAVIIINLR